MTPREERLARNEALFRGVNEKVREVKDDLEARESGELVDFICECGRANCVAQVRLTIAEYEAVRADASCFVVKPGHELDDVERVVERTERFAVVRKHPEEAQIANETDPEWKRRLQHRLDALD